MTYSLITICRSVAIASVALWVGASVGCSTSQNGELIPKLDRKTDKGASISTSSESTKGVSVGDGGLLIGSQKVEAVQMTAPDGGDIEMQSSNGHRISIRSRPVNPSTQTSDETASENSSMADEDNK